MAEFPYGTIVDPTGKEAIRKLSNWLQTHKGRRYREIALRLARRIGIRYALHVMRIMATRVQQPNINRSEEIDMTKELIERFIKVAELMIFYNACVRCWEGEIMVLTESIQSLGEFDYSTLAASLREEYVDNIQKLQAKIYDARLVDVNFAWRRILSNMSRAIRQRVRLNPTVVHTAIERGLALADSDLFAIREQINQN